MEIAADRAFEVGELDDGDGGFGIAEDGASLMSSLEVFSARGSLERSEISPRRR